MHPHAGTDLASSCSPMSTQAAASTTSSKPHSSQSSRLGVTTSLAAQAAAALVPSTSSTAFHYTDDEQQDDTSLYFEDDIDIPAFPTSFAQSQEQTASPAAAPTEAVTAGKCVPHQHHAARPLPTEATVTALPQQQTNTISSASKQAGPAMDEHAGRAMPVSDDDSPDIPMSTDLQPHVIIRYPFTVPGFCFGKPCAL